MLGPTATVAEALAQIRDPDWVVSIAAQVFVCQPPFQAPDRQVPRYRPRPAPAARSRRAWSCGHCVSNDPVVAPDATDRAVAELLASYDMLAVAVCDASRPAARRGHGRRRARPPARHRRGANAAARTDQTTDRVARHGEAPRRPHRPAGERARLGVGYDPDAFGRFAESIARYLGTARFLVWQSCVIVVWIVWNLARSRTGCSSTRGTAASCCSPCCCRCRRRTPRR